MLIFRSERGVEALVPSATHAGFRIVNISRTIKPLLDAQNNARMDTSFSLFNLHRKEYHHWFPIGSGTVPTGSVIGNTARDRKPVRWTRSNIQNVTAGCIYNDSNVNYYQYVGDNSGDVHRMNVTTETAWGAYSYNVQMLTKYYTQGYPERMKTYGWSFVDAETSGDYNVTVTQVLARSGLPSSAANVDTIAAEDPSGWGVGTWGVAPWGGSGYAGEMIRPLYARRGSGMRLVLRTPLWFKVMGLSIASTLRRQGLAA